MERRPDRVAERLDAEPIRVVVVDARGALTQGLAAARSLGVTIDARHGAMLVLLSRGDGDAAAAAQDAGATGVLVSPFGEAAFVSALRLAARQAERLAVAASTDAEAELRRQDPLTGLATADQLQDWLAPRLAAATPAFVLIVGVGRVAQINAAYGRVVADRVLSAVAQRMGQIVDGRGVPGSRLLARLAAAEFAVALAGDVGLLDATRLAQLLTGAFDRPFLIDDHVIHLSVRIGIAGHAEGGGGDPGAPAGWIRKASAALAAARTGDAGTIEIFRADPTGDPLTRLADLEADLHDAIAGDAITLLFQPQLALASGRIVGVEALVRWDHPQLGLLPAETLFETAASAELAIRLGRHIRARALALAAAWTGTMAQLRLSLNVTAADLADAGFVEALEAAIDASGLPRRRLTLEVTEGALIDDMRGAMNLLSSLRATGVRVALDDFGTGYSSLAWMAMLPVDVIKLDRSFTLGLTGSPRERVVVETVVRLSKQLGFTVVAEGVEDEAQFEAVRLAGCDAVQGFKVAAPLGLVALGDFCAGWEVRELG
ncbi:hypothetical protein IP88_05365 [alpha proteobacterium AAP81b]|nr:hypothetical protein IP88_05365 [alpha proteobacterium AAP81b]